MAQKRMIGGKVRWVARHRTPDGKEGPSKTFATKKEANAWEAEKRREVRLGTYLDPATEKITVGELYDLWTLRPGIRPSTEAIYSYSRANLTPILDYPVRKLSRKHVDDLYAQLTTGRPWSGGTAISSGTARAIISKLRAAVLMGVERGYVGRCEVVVPRAEIGDDRHVDVADIPTPDEVEAVAALLEAGGTKYQYIDRGKARIAVARPDPMIAEMVRICGDVGLRISELCALQVRDIHFLRRELMVVRQMTKRTGVTGPPKTKASRRYVPLAEHTVEAFAKLCVGKKSEDFIFTKDNGRPYTGTTAGEKLQNAAEHIGIHLRFHGLRHYYATRLIGAGVPVNAVQAALGHTKASITLDIYTHFWPGQDDRIREALSRAIAGRGDSAGLVAAQKAQEPETAEVTALNMRKNG